ncbi:DUF7512 family protein [Natrarchaeobius oligotrophus]|nr:hypothetical protein [Natrarchaeobius chitinivorans]
MIDAAMVPGPVQAIGFVALVFVQAVALYAGYGVLERTIGPAIIEKLGNA